MDLYYKKSVKEKNEIENFMVGYVNFKDFFVKKIVEGIGMISVVFYFKFVIVRMSDFKFNEYMCMFGGFSYEFNEENFMFGYRGVSWYYLESYNEVFLWECEVLVLVREEMGLMNMKVMIFFLWIIEEGKKVLEILRKNNLEFGKNGFEIYIMCELFVNVILVDDFLSLFDGFFIGFNDLI